MPIDSSLQDWLAIASIILTIVAIILQYKDKISQTKTYKKVASKVGIYYLRGIKRKFLITTVVFAFIGISLISISIYQIKYPLPTVQNNTIYPKDFIDEGRGGFFEISEAGDMLLAINKNQIFLWKRGWNENKKLRKIQFEYSTLGTQIIIGLGSNQTSYKLDRTSGTSKLESENILIPYEKNRVYYVSIVNVGESPFYLLSITTEEEVLVPEDRTVIQLFVGYILFMFSLIFFKKHKNIIKDEQTPSLDLLKTEAKYADRVENIEMELELYQNMLKELEELNLKNDLSPNFYKTKKNHYEENIHKLTEEKNTIAIEIKDILGKFKKE